MYIRIISLYIICLYVFFMYLCMYVSLNKKTVLKHVYVCMYVCMYVYSGAVAKFPVYFL